MECIHSLIPIIHMYIYIYMVKSFKVMHCRNLRAIKKLTTSSHFVSLDFFFKFH